MVMQVEDVKNTLHTHGTFSMPSILGPEADEKSKDLRLRGKPNFLAGPVPKNPYKGFQRLYEGEQWTSDYERSRTHANQAAKKNMTDHGFKYSSPNKKSSGLGNYYGALGPKHKHEGEAEGAGKGEKPPPAELEPRQVLTGPPKKGRFNTPGITFGAPQPKGVAHVLGKEFEYHSDPYNLARKLEMEERAKSKALRQEKPFKAMARSSEFFDETKSGVSSRIYAEVPMPPKKPPPPELPRVGDKPFYPSRGPKSGIYGAISAFPEHMEDSEQARFDKALQHKKKEREFGAWKYGAGSKSMLTRSILFHHPGMSTLACPTVQIWSSVNGAAGGGGGCCPGCGAGSAGVSPSPVRPAAHTAAHAASAARPAPRREVTPFEAQLQLAVESLVLTSGMISADDAGGGGDDDDDPGLRELRARWQAERARLLNLTARVDALAREYVARRAARAKERAAERLQRASAAERQLAELQEEVRHYRSLHSSPSHTPRQEAHARRAGESPRSAPSTERGSVARAPALAPLPMPPQPQHGGGGGGAPLGGPGHRRAGSGGLGAVRSVAPSPARPLPSVGAGARADEPRGTPSAQRLREPSLERGSSGKAGELRQLRRHLQQMQADSSSYAPADAPSGSAGQGAESGGTGAPPDGSGAPPAHSPLLSALRPSRSSAPAEPGGGRAGLAASPGGPVPVSASAPLVEAHAADAAASGAGGAGAQAADVRARRRSVSRLGASLTAAAQPAPRGEAARAAPLRVLQRAAERHSGAVAALCSAEREGCVLSAGADGFVQLWEWRGAPGCWVAGQRIACRGGNVNALCYSARARVAAAGCEDGSVRLFRIADAHTDAQQEGGRGAGGGGGDSVPEQPRHAIYLLRSLRGHAEEVMCAAALGWLATGSQDSTIRLWNLATGECAQTLSGHTSWVMALRLCYADGSDSAASGTPCYMLSASGDGTARLWIDTGLSPAGGAGAPPPFKLKGVLRGHGRALLAAELIPALGLAATGSDDQTVRLWSLASQECVLLLGEQPAPVCALSWHANRRQLVSACEDRSLRVWELACEGKAASAECVASMPSAGAADSAEGAADALPSHALALCPAPSGPQLLCGLDDGSLLVLLL